MPLQNLSMPRSKPLEQPLEVLEILNSSYSGYRKYMLKSYPPTFPLDPLCRTRRGDCLNHLSHWPEKPIE